MGNPLGTGPNLGATNLFDAAPTVELVEPAIEEHLVFPAPWADDGDDGLLLGAASRVSYTRSSIAYDQLSAEAQAILNGLTEAQWAEATANAPVGPLPENLLDPISINAALDSNCLHLDPASVLLACVEVFLVASAAPSSHCSPPPSTGFQCFRIQGDADVESLLDFTSRLERTGTHLDWTCVADIGNVIDMAPATGCEGCGSDVTLYIRCGTTFYTDTHVHSIGTLCANAQAFSDTVWMANLNTAPIESGPDC